MAELKTAQNQGNVNAFLASVDDETKKKDCQRLVKLMGNATGAKPKMWGSSIVGFGNSTLTQAGGRTSDWMQVAFSPRKSSLVIYIMNGFSSYDRLLNKLGKHSTGKSCLYVKRLSDVDEGVLGKMIEESVAYMKKKNPYQGPQAATKETAKKKTAKKKTAKKKTAKKKTAKKKTAKKTAKKKTAKKKTAAKKKQAKKRR